MPESTVWMPRMAIYYPYIHFRDEGWLKVAALYWPSMLRIVSPDYPVRNSNLVDVLTDELGFVVDHPPDSAARAVAEPFLGWIESLELSAATRWRIPREAAYGDPSTLTLPRPPSTLDSTASSCLPPSFEHYGPKDWRRPGGMAGVHRSEVSPSLAEMLVEAGLAVPARGEWLAMHPELAWIYKCRLTEELAQRNKLVPTTDQLSAHAVVAGTVATGLTDRHSEMMMGASESVDLVTRFGLLAVTAVVPRDLSEVPAKKIVEVRRRFGEQFDRWRQHIDEVGAELAEQLRDVESPAVVEAYLTDAVRRYASVPTEELRRGLTSLGLDTVNSTVSTKVALPAGLAAAGTLVGSHVATAGGIALAVLGLRRRNRQDAADMLTAAPAAYLLDITETLAPQTWISRVISAIHRAAGLGA